MRVRFFTARILPAALLWILVAAGSVSGEGFKITAIDVRGANRVPADSIRQAMSTQVGQELDLDKIKDDIKAISRMGYFRDVFIDSEEERKGFRLTVVVTEKPIVGAIAITGNKDVEQSTLREALALKERSLFSEDKVKESVSKLKEVLQNQGFIDATVESSVTQEQDGSTRIEFAISEGEKLKIEKIVFSGNLYFSKRQLLKKMETSEKGFFSFITQSGVVKRDVLETDILKIEATYQNAGFMDSKIFDPQFQRGKGGMVLLIRVAEGKQYRVGNITFIGDHGLAEETLRKTVKLKSGDIFNREELVSDLLALTTLVNDDGYAQALVSPGAERRKEYPVTDVVYRIDRGAKFRFGKVDVSGNTKTYDRIIRRRLLFSEGETYSATNLKESKENLTRPSYFKDVKITTAPSGKPGEMDVNVEVQEAPTGTLSGGAGYSTMDGPFGIIQLSENNLFGRGWRASLSSQFGSRRNMYMFDFIAPHFMDTDFSLIGSLYKTKIRYNDFEKDSVGGRVGTGIDLSRFVNASVVFSVDSTRISARSNVNPSRLIQEEINKGRRSTHSVIFNIVRNTTNRFMDPSKGKVYSASLQYAGGPFGGDSQFVKYLLNYKAYYPVTESTVFSMNFNWGQVVPTDGGWSRGEVPLYERFFLGGPYSVRGFRARSISPIDPATGDSIGGNKYFVSNFEFQFPLAADVGFKGVLFIDAGNTWGKGAAPFRHEGLWTGYGVGVRWYSPMGPMRFEYGWNTDRPPGAPAGVFEFTVGTAF
ncbi:MAG: outer membrane protein assembly factor BamA [Syntrophorhabdaceae bacterium]|nr:outer membrane protein assembly factor BamA [Syntrophorhabdaceae bacterium]